MKPKLLIHLFIFSFCISFSHAQPSDSDYLLGYGGNILLLGTEFVFKKDLTPIEPGWTDPRAFDIFFRNKLKWDNRNLNQAAFYSDILLKGIFLPSVFWSSYQSGYKYSYYLLLQMQVIAATGIATYMSKFITGRQRPYSYYNTRLSHFPEDNLSFFSGHSSFSFAIATSSAHLLEKAHPANSGLIWSTGLILASVTAYLRVAADRHYMTDILTGMVIGSAAGYLIAKNQRKKFFKVHDRINPDFHINFTIPL